jgi:hypothetical protein
MSFPNTNPLPGDSDNNLLAKLVQLFGGTPASGDTDNVLLTKVLRLVNTAEPCECGGGGGGGSSVVSFTFALTGNEDAIAVLTDVEKWRAPFAFTITEVRASLNVAATGGSLVTVDINKGGSTILSTKLTIDHNEVTSVTAATPAVISDTAVADDDEFTFDIDAGGNPAAGLKVTIIGTIDA